jgi:hypothetical protein
LRCVPISSKLLDLYSAAFKTHIIYFVEQFRRRFNDICSYVLCDLGTNVVLIAQILNFNPCTLWSATAQSTNEEPE